MAAAAGGLIRARAALAQRHLGEHETRPPNLLCRREHLGSPVDHGLAPLVDTAAIEHHAMTRLILGRDGDRDADRVSDRDRVAKARASARGRSFRARAAGCRAAWRSGRRPTSPWATIPWNLSLRAYSSSTWAGFMSPDITANSSTSRQLDVRSRAALSPTSISSNVRFSIGGASSAPMGQGRHATAVRNPL